MLKRNLELSREKHCCSVAQSCPTLCYPMNCSTPGFPVLHHLLEFAQLMSIELVIPSNCLILCHPLCLLLSLFPSVRFFSNESAVCSRWPKYWNFSFSISPFNEYSGLISIRIDWFDHLAVQGILKILFSSTTVQRHQFFGSQPFYFPVLISIHDYWKKHSFDYKCYVSKAVSLIFNMLSSFVIAFLPRSKNLLISWLRSPSTVILQTKKIKSVTVSIVPPSICHEAMGPDAMIFIFWMLSFKPVF